MSNLDLDINSYNYEDLLDLFSLNKEFSDKNIDTINETVQVIKKQRPQLYDFYFKASRLILTIYGLYNNDLILNNDGQTIDTFIVKIKKISNYEQYTIDELIDKLDLLKDRELNNFIQPNIQPYFIKEQVKTNSIENTVQNSIAPGNLNAIKRLTHTINLNLNSCFRNNYYNSNPSDFQYTLPVSIKNVISLRLASIEIPCYWYLFSTTKKNNIFFIEITNGSTITKYEIIIPDGNYTSTALADYLNNTYFYLSTTVSDLNNLKFSINPYTKKSTFENVGSPFSFTLIFFNETTSQNILNTAGWILGFRLPTYKNINTSIVSEGLFDASIDRYIYVSLEDYQYNNNSLNIVCFNKSTIEKNIIAKIPLVDGKICMTIDESCCPSSKARKYNGPVNIRNINVKLLDRFGDTIELNHMDYSFTLELEVLYEGFNFKDINA